MVLVISGHSEIVCVLFWKCATMCCSQLKILEFVSQAQIASCGFRGVMHPWFIFFYFSTIYCVCFPTYLFFFTFPYLSSSLLIFSFENRPALFPGRMSQKATTSGFSFLCLLCVVIHFFWLLNACFYCVRFRPRYRAKGHTRGNVSKVTYFWRIGRKTTT